MKKPIYKIKHDGYDWVATTSQFKNLSGCGRSPQQAMVKLCWAERQVTEEILKENK